MPGKRLSRAEKEELARLTGRGAARQSADRILSQQRKKRAKLSDIDKQLAVLRGRQSTDDSQ
jgi:hypothetical protein